MRNVLLIASMVIGLGTGLPAQEIDFNRDIRPILSNSCFQCHGPDAGQRQADLRLDTRDGLFRSADGVRITVAGKPESSELWARISSTDESTMMPPPDSGRSLTASEKLLVRRWIESGASWKGHWAYLPVSVRPVPKEAGEGAAIIDWFVDRQRSRQGLSAARPADRITLIRRLSFDLNGLPPTPDEARQFLEDPADDAYERLVDRLLASPRFGERMAMYWLDLVRYADTNGIHGDNHRDISLYRDWVIEAFQQNKPFDQFTIEQIAGDLLEPKTPERLVASGYNRLLMTTREGGAQPKEYLAKYAADRVRNVSSVWLGATMACAECHDHKYDPYSTRDFYRMASFFADVQEVAVGAQPTTPIPTTEQQQQLDQIVDRRATVEREMKADTAELQKAQADWEADLLKQLDSATGIWSIARPTVARGVNGTQLEHQDGDSYLATGPNPDRETYEIEIPLTDQTVTGIRLEALRHESLSNGSLSRANGNFVLNRVELSLRPEGSEQARTIAIKAALADFSQNGFPIANTIDGKPETGWAVDGHNRKEDRSAVFVLATPLSAPGATLLIRLHHESIYAKHNIGRFRISLTGNPSPSLEDSLLPEPLLAILRKPVAERSPTESAQLRDHFRGVCDELSGQRQELAELQKREEQIRRLIPRTLVTTAMQPREMRVLPRGNWLDNTGDVVQPGVPGFLDQISREGRANRMDLARWLVDPQNPLTARVFVNRLWKLMFGQGIVRTLDDFGSQGAWPTHPELLDWLAREFVASGWDVKRLVKLLVMTETYRQSSAAGNELRQGDPYNRWLARQSAYRLDAEMIRDSALLASGLLVEKVGGPSVKPYQPAGYWAHLNFPKRTWQAGSGDELYRRGLYTYWCRTFLHPSLLAFDAPTREECTVERARSNNPLQALVLLNDPTYVEASRVLAQRVLSETAGKEDEPADDEAILDRMFSLILTRSPTANEKAVLLELCRRHQTWFSSHQDEAGKLLGVGASQVKSGLPNDRLAAWTSVARVLLNLHETITRS